MGTEDVRPFSELSAAGEAGPRPPVVSSSSSPPMLSRCEREIGSVEMYRLSGRLRRGKGGGGRCGCRERSPSFPFALSVDERAVTVLLRERPAAPPLLLAPGAVYSRDRISSSSSSSTPPVVLPSLVKEETVSPRFSRGSMPLKLESELSERFLCSVAVWLCDKASSLEEDDDGFARRALDTAVGADEGGSFRRRVELRPMCEEPSKRTVLVSPRFEETEPCEAWYDARLLGRFGPPPPPPPPADEALLWPVCCACTAEVEMMSILVGPIGGSVCALALEVGVRACASEAFASAGCFGGGALGFVLEGGRGGRGGDFAVKDDSGGDGGKLAMGSWFAAEKARVSAGLLDGCADCLKAGCPAAADGIDAGARRKGLEPAMGVSGLSRPSLFAAGPTAVELDAAPAPAPACSGAFGSDAARLAGGGGAGAFFLPATASRRLVVFVVLASFLGGGGKESDGEGDAAAERSESGVAESSSYVRKKGFADFEGISFVSIKGDVCRKRRKARWACKVGREELGGGQRHVRMMMSRV